MGVYSDEGREAFDRWRKAYEAHSQSLEDVVAARALGWQEFAAQFDKSFALHEEAMRLFGELQAYRIDQG